MKPRKFRMSEKQRQWVRDWWRSLDPGDQDKDAMPGELRGQGRADRARLRRCQNAEELLSKSATLLFARRLIALGGSSKVFSDESQVYEKLAWVRERWRMSRRIRMTIGRWHFVWEKLSAESALQ